MNQAKQSLLIGAHTSAAGGVHNAILEGARIGATTIQLFTSNQKRWQSKPIDEAEINLWKAALEETGLSQVMSHDSYLINLGSPNPEMLQKSRDAFAAEAARCVQLDIAYLNFHPGAHLNEGLEACMDRIVEGILHVKPILEKGRTRLLLEATAGQGSAVGAKFEELAYILEKVSGQVPVGVCIDTCHIFVAGYDIRTPEAFDQTLKTFDRVVGLQHLYAFHLNDSLKGLGSRVDRHAHLGQGMIGLEAFKCLMQDPRTRHLPKYLETPEGPSVWVKEIQMLRELGESA